MGKCKKITLGITLFELIVTMALVAMLTLMALPSYKAYLLVHRRHAAEIALFAGRSALLAEHRHPTTDPPYYRLTTQVNKRQGLQITATPYDQQSKDVCGTLSLDMEGNKTPNAAACWVAH